MIVFNLIVFSKDQIDDIVNCILNNKFALQVVVIDGLDSYHLDSQNLKIHSPVYNIQFVTKSLLFKEIESTLNNEFPGTNFQLFANLILHINAPLYDNIINLVTGVSTKDKD